MSTLQALSFHLRQKRKSPPSGGLFSFLAGVEGFEPPNGGIKTRGPIQLNQQVIDSPDPPRPLQSPRVPIAGTKAGTRRQKSLVSEHQGGDGHSATG